MNLKKNILVKTIFLMTIFSSCTHSIHQYNAGNYDYFFKKDKYDIKTVNVMSEQMVILGIVTDTRFVEDAYLNLKEKCPHGKIKGIHTRFSTSHGFFYYTNKLYLQGHCMTPKSSLLSSSHP